MESLANLSKWRWILFTATFWLRDLVLVAHSTTVSDMPDDTLLWGPYRPNLYFGLRPRIPESLSFGLMWATVQNDGLDTKRLRHTCEQGDHMDGYGWEMYDVRNGGTQTILDPQNNLAISTKFAKISQGYNKGSWGVRIQGSLKDQSIHNNVSTVW